MAIYDYICTGCGSELASVQTSAVLCPKCGCFMRRKPKPIPEPLPGDPRVIGSRINGGV